MFALDVRLIAGRVAIVAAALGWLEAAKLTALDPAAWPAVLERTASVVTCEPASAGCVSVADANSGLVEPGFRRR